MRTRTGWPVAHRAVAVAAVGAASLLLLASSPALAATLEVPTSKEAWYRTPLVGGGEDPACDNPAGCPFQAAAPADAYPEDTLHVGAVAGRQESATFLTFPTSGIPAGAELTSGTAFLPVASQDAGTVSPDAAALVACLVTEPYTATQGGPPEELPAVDCGTSAEAVYEPDADPARFVVDLTPFIQRWEAGARNHGIGLLVAEDAEGTWHVAFSATGREGDVVPAPTAELTYTLPVGDGGPRPFLGIGGSDPPESSTDDGAPSTAPPPPAAQPPATSSAPSFGVGPAPPPVTAPQPASEPAPVAAPPAAAPPAAPTQVAGAQAGFAYPVAWLLPLMLLLGATSLMGALGTEVAVVRAGEPRDLVGRLWLAFFPRRGA